MAQDMSLEDARDYFRQGGVDVGGRHLFAVSIATNGPVTHLAALDVNDDVWLWKDTEPEKWIKLPRVPFLERTSETPHLSSEGKQS